MTEKDISVAYNSKKILILRAQIYGEDVWYSESVQDSDPGSSGIEVSLARSSEVPVIILTLGMKRMLMDLTLSVMLLLLPVKTFLTRQLILPI